MQIAGYQLWFSVKGIKEKKQKFKLGWTSKVQKQKLNLENSRYFLKIFPVIIFF